MAVTASRAHARPARSPKAVTGERRQPSSLSSFTSASAAVTQSFAAVGHGNRAKLRPNGTIRRQRPKRFASAHTRASQRPGHGPSGSIAMAVTREPSPTGLSRGVERRVEPVEPSGPLSFSAIVASRPARRAFTAARPQPSRSGEPRSRLSAANVARHGLPSAALGPPSIRRTHSRT
jgi:hypothetical protein